MSLFNNLLKSFGLAAGLALAGTATATPAWNHATVQSGAVSASIDFQTARTSLAATGGVSGFQDAANPVWVNVARADLTARDNVHVLLINYIHECIGASCSDFFESNDLELKYAEAGRFTAQAHPIAFNSFRRDNFGTSTRQTRQEIVIFIDGQVVKDRSGKNIGFSLQNAIGR